MKRDVFEKYLGKKVSVTMHDSDVYTGELHKTGEDIFKNNPDLYIPHNYYVLIENGEMSCSPIFRCSHVKKIKEGKWL